jgi:ketosteroid isomerase-like protein
VGDALAITNQSESRMNTYIRRRYLMAAAAIAFSTSFALPPLGASGIADTPEAAFARYRSSIDLHSFDHLARHVIAERPIFVFGDKVYAGREAARAAFIAAWAKLPDETYRMSEARWIARDRTSAVVAFRYDYQGTTADQGVVTGGGRGTNVFQKTPDGWRLAYEHLSMTAPSKRRPQHSWHFDGADPTAPRLVHRERGKPRLALSCLLDAKELEVRVHGFVPVPSEDRLTVGAGDELLSLTTRKGAAAGVAGRGRLTAQFTTALRAGARIGASYGSQNLAPLPAAPRKILEAFGQACDPSYRRRTSQRPPSPGMIGYPTPLL